MKLPDIEIKTKIVRDPGLLDFMDYVRLILNDSRYQFRVVGSVPDWTGQEGEMVLYAAGTVRALYSYVNGTWCVLSWGTAGTISLPAAHYIGGAELEYVNANDVKAAPGGIEINGEVFTRTTYSSTVELDQTTLKLNGTADAASTTFYIYAYNDSATTWDIKYSDEAPAYYDCNTSDTTGTLRYRDYSDVWYRCIGAVRNDGSQNIIKFYQSGDWMFFVEQQDLSFAQQSWTDVDLRTFGMPAFSRIAKITMGGLNAAGAVRYLYARINGESTTYLEMRVESPTAEYAQIDIPTDSSQVIEVQSTCANGNYGYLHGYYIGNIR